MTAGAFRLLVVCTANQCRSPMGEVIARDLAARRGIDVVVGSAGTRALPDIEATAGAIDTVRRRGLDLTAHRSRPVDAVLVASSDLIVTMERQHVLDLVNEHGAPLHRVFTLPELASAALGAGVPLIGETPTVWLDRIGGERSPMSILAAREIDDPIGRSNRHYRRAATEIEAALDAVVAAIGATSGAPDGDR